MSNQEHNYLDDPILRRESGGDELVLRDIVQREKLIDDLADGADTHVGDQAFVEYHRLASEIYEAKRQLGIREPEPTIPVETDK